MESLSYEEDDDIIKPDSIFDDVITHSMFKVTSLESLSQRSLHENKIEELESMIDSIKTDYLKLKNVVNYIVKDLHYISELQNIQPIYDSNGKIIETIVNEGWLDRRIPILIDSNGFWKRYKLDGKLYDIKEKGVILEVNE